MWLFPSLVLVFIVIAATRPRSSRLLRGRCKREPAQDYKLLRPIRQRPNPTAGLRDPSRPL